MMEDHYHTAILVNTVNRRYHPMPFRCNPRPSDDLVPGQYCRHKSIGHHTVGFATLDEAVADIAKNEHLWPTGVLLKWDGEGIPASIMDFPAWTKMELKEKVEPRPHMMHDGCSRQ
jgi:hypothetical protein